MSRTLARRWLQLVSGLTLYGTGLALVVRAGLGVDPWDVLSLGIVAQTGLSFGLVTNAIGALVLLLWIPLRQRPGVGTVLNVILVGTTADLGLWLLPAIGPLGLRVLVFAGGLALVAVATGLYIGARFGPGPRDGLMTGIVARTGWPVWAVRTGIEVSALALGWALGGLVGLGTLAFALLIGPMVAATLPLFAVPQHPSPAPVATTGPSAPRTAARTNGAAA